ncbi:ATP-binding protein [Actinomadura macrotermitis]|uniref:histidine kinase n=1 Tax=Actinomadura macrotermitis TaxID=2585200 RepID=A0A7K0C3T4_9ACTN|nr:ATP-binding protein [Actinomadura macrotermitis]MQY08127.1 Sensor histidine kinase RcsC [Actinomadura macrotermitis]
MPEQLLRFQIADEEGVFAVRRTGRQVAAAAGLDAQDQVRVATALSEVGRELFACSGEVSVAFQLEPAPAPALVVELAFTPPAGADRLVESKAAAARLMDAVEETGGAARRAVRLRKNLPAGTPRPSGPELEALRVRLRRLRPVTALEELRTQNADLVQALGDLRRQSEELRSLNSELEETNQGVVALYNELSTELEETNRGVVALYAELEEKSDQLREAGTAKNRFWASISHELRTPVNGVIGLSRLLLDPAADPLTGEQRHQITLIGDAGQTLLSLVNELLDMAKAEQGGLAPHRAPVEVAPLLRQLSELLAPMAQQAGVDLRVDAAGAPDDGVVVTDELMLSRVLRNLLSNGIRFTDEGEVRLTVRSGPDHLDFVVADTGIGIPVHEQERVFEEFYQVPGGKPGGTGLGLTYSRRLARALGGDLLLDSEAGAGTTVTLRLPPHRALADLGIAHALIAGGDDTVREVLRRMLGEAAGRVSEAADAREARSLAAADPPDLVLLGGLAGTGVRDVLRALAPDAAVVLIASAGAVDDAARARAGALLEPGRLAPALLADAVARAVAEAR